MARQDQLPTLFFASAPEWEAWLEREHERADGLWMSIAKRGAPRPTVSYSDALDVALCFGWIDGVRRSLGEEAYMIRFTPRKPSSTWSAINVAKVAALVEEGKMTAAGLEAFKSRTAAKTGTYSYERNKAAKLPRAYEEALRANRRAAAFFDAQAPWYRRTATHWVISAKREETRERRLAQLIADSAKGLEIPPLRFRTPKGG
jgi:uncharacterized protein YdeI (YjbR/CyaY-like superfamily)